MTEAVPIEAATVDAPPAMTTKRSTCSVESNANRPRARRIVSQVARRASNVLPPAIAREVKTWPELVTLTTKAPNVTTGHARTPSTRSAAIARPLGGQTALAFSLANASINPRRPAAM